MVKASAASRVAALSPRSNPAAKKAVRRDTSGTFPLDGFPVLSLVAAGHSGEAGPLSRVPLVLFGEFQIRGSPALERFLPDLLRALPSLTPGRDGRAPY